MNPYRVLKVKKTATPEEIKNAYRRESLKHHPDRNPGKDTSARFNEVNAAYRVLSDPQRRERYDRTGEVDEEKPDNPLSEALVVLSASYTETILEAVSIGRDLRNVDLVSAMKAKIGEKIKPIRKELSDMNKVEAAFKESSTRFETDTSFEPILSIINQHRKNLQEQREMRQKIIDTLEHALKILSAYRYRTDKSESEKSFAEFLADARATATGPFFIFE